MSYLTKKWMHKKRVLKNFRGSNKLPQAHKKCVMKMKDTKKKWHTHKNVIYGRKHFIGCLHKTSEDAYDWDNLRANDSRHNEGTICLVNGWMSANCKGMVFECGCINRCSLFKSHWLVLRIGGADFLHCWVIDSIWLEHAESLIIKQWL